MLRHGFAFQSAGQAIMTLFTERGHSEFQHFTPKRKHLKSFFDHRQIESNKFCYLNSTAPTLSANTKIQECSCYQRTKLLFNI